VIHSLIHSISEIVSRNGIIFFRGDEERRSLEAWLAGNVESTVTVPDTDSVEVDKDRIREIVASCGRCTGAGEKKVNYGSGSNGVMILLHLPEKITTHEMKAYRSQSNEVLRKMLTAIQLDIDHCYLTNLIKCEAGATHQPSRMFAECADILRAEIAEISPGIIIVMGSFGPVAKISKEFPDIKWFNTEHPVTLIKNPDMKRGAWETLKLVRSWLDGK